MEASRGGQRAKRRLIRGAYAAALLLGGLFAATPAGAVSSGGTHLPFSQYTDMVVDEAAGHIFFTSNTSTVTVTDLSGVDAQTINGLAGSSGLALSPDGSTIYVAATSANTIASIDTTSLAVTKPFTGLSCPSSLAFAGGKLYFSYGCAVGESNIGSIDVANSSPTVSTDLVNDYWYSPPYFADTPPSSNVLVAGQQDMEPATIISYDVADGSPVKLAQNDSDSCENLESMAVTTDGAEVAVACGSPYHVSTYNTADLSGIDTYGGDSPYPAAVAFSADDSQLAAGYSGYDDPNVVIYPSGDPSSTILGEDLDVGGQGTLTRDDLRFGASGSLYAVVPTSVYDNDFDLFVIPDPALPVPILTVNAPSTDQRGSQISVSGQITSAPSLTYPLTLGISRQDANGVQVLGSVTTDDSGNFSFDDTPPVAGTATYTVSYDPIAAGDSTHAPVAESAQVDVSGDPTTLTLTTDARHYEYGSRVHLTAQLGPTSGAETVSIIAEPRGDGETLVSTKKVDSNGMLTASYRVKRSTTFLAQFNGDLERAAASARVDVTVSGKVSEAMEGANHRSHGVFRYGPTDVPLLESTVKPVQPDACIQFVAQHRSYEVWKTIHKRNCVRTDSSGTASYRFTGTHVLGAHYRIRAVWAGDATSTAAHGKWRYVVFRH